ncbi:hypothetical protein LAUMK4_05918 [Mycobacterium persicum]|uniref:Uncharacterized protein n=1 Tax=Mycobacterium persicum TaxID=1487726 RepID=A0AB38V127_9MYCO|nr:hypothetical protein LAUMK15_05726 [Mycobacterium persicum]VAZ86738.1 hypothetical protein LAUMK42_05592 [Mycobacterium persicum]VBA33336.1 hypothetical protein LAUMK4_05918 [Mycobacterium persicum]
MRLPDRGQDGAPLVVQHAGTALGGRRGGIQQLGLVVGGYDVAGHRRFHRLIALAVPVQRVGLALDGAHHRASARRQVTPVGGVLGQMRHGVSAQRRLGGDHVLRTVPVIVAATFVSKSAASESVAS